LRTLSVSETVETSRLSSQQRKGAHYRGVRPKEP
jgi:hypothetical protein